MNLIQRVTNISLNPKTEWEVIAPETTSTGNLYRNYIAPLAAVGPVSSFIGLSVIGMGIPFLGSYRMPMLPGLSSVLVQYVFALISIYLVALLIDALAPTFGAQRNKLQALKLAAYAATPAWLAGVLSLLPGLGILGFLALFYSLYLLYLGLPVMMAAPRDKTVGYTAVIAICTVVLALVAGAVAGVVAGIGGMAMAGAGGADRIKDMAQTMEAAARKIQAAQTAVTASSSQAPTAAAAQAQSEAIEAGVQFDVVDHAKLKALLPDELPGLVRSDVQAEKMEFGGISTSSASARYASPTDGARNITVSIRDTGNNFVYTAMAGWGTTERETATGYQKAGKVNGRLTRESFDKQGGEGEYMVLIGNRFSIETKGRNVDMAALKNAFDAISVAKLESMKDEGRQAPKR
jgi:hypothetical protein